MSAKDRVVTLTEPEVSHLLSLLLRNEEDGTYYGPRDQYWRRHNRIMDKLDGLESK